MSTIDLPTARRMLADALKERGSDFNYRRHFNINTCLYRIAGARPGCIIGQVAHDNNRLDDMVENIPGSEALTRVGFQLTHEAIEYLDAAQSAQDEGYDWGDSVRWAEYAVRDGSLGMRYWFTEQEVFPEPWLVNPKF